MNARDDLAAVIAEGGVFDDTGRDRGLALMIADAILARYELVPKVIEAPKGWGKR